MASEPNKPYGKNKVSTIQSIYILMIMLWIGIIIALQLYNSNIIGLLILLIPIIIFIIGIINATTLSVSVESDIFESGFLTLGIVLFIPLIVWLSGHNFHDKKQFIAIIVTALILTLLSLFDIWVKKKWITVVRHIKSSFQTMALTLLILLLYTFYLLF